MRLPLPSKSEATHEIRNNIFSPKKWTITEVNESQGLTVLQFVMPKYIIVDSALIGNP